MELSETTWKNFRNLEPRRQQWRPGLNVLLGPNGSGKTNILESFNVLSGWGVFPVSGNRTSSMVAWNSVEKRAFLSGQAQGERGLEVTAQIGERLVLRVSNERVTYSELRAFLPSLSFLPNDINLLDGSPSVRRLFIDKLCAICSPVYARRLAEYKQLVQQRVSVLRGGGSDTVLRASSAPISQLGGWIRHVRQRGVNLLNETFGAPLETPLCADDQPADARWLYAYGIPFIDMTMELRGGRASAELDGCVEELRLALETGAERERAAGLVLVGPHRDDIAFSCLGRPAALALSRGQKRRVVMALILAAGRLIEAKLRLKPILILDDIAAELDADGKSLMGKALAETGWQVFATGVEDPFHVPESTIWHVCDGKIAE